MRTVNSVFFYSINTKVSAYTASPRVYKADGWSREYPWCIVVKAVRILHGNMLNIAFDCSFTVLLQTFANLFGNP